MHDDDFLVTGSRSDLLWLRDKLGSKDEVKTHLLGPEDEQDIKTFKHCGPMESSWLGI